MNQTTPPASSQKRVLFRADGGSVIGMGHLMRSRSLAVELQKLGWDVVFCGTGIPRGFGPTPGQGFEVKTAEGSLVDQALELGIRLLIVDSYDFSSEDFRALQRPDWILGAIDDMADRTLTVDLVINPNPRFDPAPYERLEIPLRMVGEEAVMVRPEVIARRPTEPIFRPDGPILFTLGGGNVEDLMLKILAATPFIETHPIVVSVTPNCPVTRLRGWEAAHKGWRKVNTDPDLFPQLLSEAGFVVSGGGTTLWEIFTLGIPCLALVYVDNQAHSLKLAEQTQTALCLDLQTSFSEEPLRHAFHALTDDPRAAWDMITKQRALIDGQGAARNASRIDQAFRERFGR